MIEFGPTTSRICAVVAIVLPAIFWGVFGFAFLTGANPPPGFPWLPPPLVGILLVTLPAGALVLWWLSRSGQVELPPRLAALALVTGALFFALAVAALVAGF